MNYMIENSLRYHVLCSRIADKGSPLNEGGGGGGG